jgi:hypothetical protein
LKIFKDSWAEEYGTKKEKKYFSGLIVSEILEEQLILF